MILNDSVSIFDELLENANVQEMNSHIRNRNNPVESLTASELESVFWSAKTFLKTVKIFVSIMFKLHVSIFCNYFVFQVYSAESLKPFQVFLLGIAFYIKKQNKNL